MTRVIAVYEVRPDFKNYHALALENSSDRFVFDRFDGSSLVSDWRPLPGIAADTDDELAQIGDYSLLGTIPVMSERAVDVLAKELEGNGELLPVKYRGRTLFAYNVTRVVDALDERGSLIARLPSGSVLTINRYAFKADSLVHVGIFKMPPLPRAYVFATDAFVHAVRDAQLTGFYLRLGARSLVD